MKPRSFRSRWFWISYIAFAIFSLVVSRLMALFDIGGFFLFVCSVVFPVPFFLFGYFAPRVRFTVLYALIVWLISFLMFFFGVPALESFLDPRSRIPDEPDQKHSSMR